MITATIEPCDSGFYVRCIEGHCMCKTYEDALAYVARLGATLVEAAPARVPAFERSIEDVFDALADMPPAANHLLKVSGAPAKLLAAQLRVYHRAQKSKAAARAGIVGVGLITYAQARLARFNARCAYRAAQPRYI